MRELLAVLIALNFIDAATAEAAPKCKFVDVNNPNVSISLEDYSKPVGDYEGRIVIYESIGGGTGISSRGAFDPNDVYEPNIDYTYDVHEFEGKRFLVFGPSLLVERCSADPAE